MIVFDTFAERTPVPGKDPWVVVHGGVHLLVQSARNDRRIEVKRFSDLERMDQYETFVIWDPPRRSDHARQIWAPELHHIDGHWYVYYAASDGWNRNHRIYVLEADQPLGPYRELGRISDGQHDTWAIDMTVFRHRDRLYAAWSGWEGENDGFPQHLYIAPMANPWTLAAPRRRIATPEHPWESSVAPVNEGPQAIRNGPWGRLFLLYSADASWTPAYKMGLLELVGDDPADPASWRKWPDPVFEGGGHGCVIETAGGLHLVYHRKMTAEPGWSDREIRTAPFSWDADGYPVLAGGRELRSSTRPSAPAVSRSGDPLPSTSPAMMKSVPPEPVG